jgi:hypothetical protein
MRAGAVLLGFALLPMSSLLLAEETSAPQGSSTPADEERRLLEVHGFLLGVVSGRTTGQRPSGGDGGDFVLGEERVRLDLSGATRSGKTSYLAKGDLFHDAVANRFDVDLREAYAGYTGDILDLRLGRQIITWGVGDLFFINDVFPKDWDSFFSGRPMEYLKLGVDGFRGQLSSTVVNAEFLAIPFFTPDTLPSADRFFLFDPAAGVPNRREEEPERGYSNTELALRLYRRLAGFDASVYAYRGFWRTPAVRFDDPSSPTTATRFFPKLSVYGASVQRGLLAGVVSLEAGYYDSREDPDGDDPTVPNSQWRFLAGYQRQLWEDFTVGIQGYGEVMAGYDTYGETLPGGSPRQNRFRGVVSTRLSQLLDYQTWKLSLFVAYGPTDGDYFLQPEISYKVTEDLRVSLGANVFGGERETTFFGQFERSDNVFATARYDF